MYYAKKIFLYICVLFSVLRASVVKAATATSAAAISVAAYVKKEHKSAML
jgi:hypothetical protein